MYFTLLLKTHARDYIRASRDMALGRVGDLDLDGQLHAGNGVVGEGDLQVLSLRLDGDGVAGLAVVRDLDTQLHGLGRRDGGSVIL